jgi:hypothetical protein
LKLQKGQRFGPSDCNEIEKFPNLYIKDHKFIQPKCQQIRIDIIQHSRVDLQRGPCKSEPSTSFKKIGCLQTPGFAAVISISVLLNGHYCALICRWSSLLFVPPHKKNVSLVAA